MFADTGTYLSQAVHRYIGWDRPPFYSLFMFPLHLTLSTWFVVIAQALFTVWILRLLIRCMTESDPDRWIEIAALVLGVTTWLPWLVSELMPDLFTPLLTIVLCLLGFASDRLTGRERGMLVVAGAGMTAMQISSVALYPMLVTVIWVSRRFLPIRDPPASRLRYGEVILVVPFVITLLALLTMNGIAHGRPSLSPYGNMFLLARLLDDGPATRTLVRDCPASGWRLCVFVSELPMDADDFLWKPDSPVVRLGGHKVVSNEADAIIGPTVRTEPLSVMGAMARNAVEQLRRFASGDGLQPWPDQVTRWIEGDFSSLESRAYHNALQTRGGARSPGLARDTARRRCDRRCWTESCATARRVVSAAPSCWLSDYWPGRIAGQRHHHGRIVRAS